jgi:hypothetical protein
MLFSFPRVRGKVGMGAGLHPDDKNPPPPQPSPA